MIEVRGLVKSLGTTRILDGVTFTAGSGEVTGLLGPNGAGKTTTMRILATLLRPDEGTVHIEGIDLAADPLEVRRRIGLVTEEPGLFDRLTVREQLGFMARVHGMSSASAAERIEHIAEGLRLGDLLDRRAGVLSKGNRQKVSVCRALVHDPPVLLLDEPTSGLDVVSADGLQQLLAEGALTGSRTVLLSTHRVDEAERLCDRLVGLANGRVVVDAPLSELSSGADGASFRETFIRLLGEATMEGQGSTR